MSTSGQLGRRRGGGRSALADSRRPQM